MNKIITVKNYDIYEETILGSKFITQIWHINSEEEAKAIIKEINSKYYDATHNCYAYIVDQIERFSDDGEPQKTAGYPILEAIKYAELKYTLIIVTRYFGGTLLGTGGLIRAYGNGAREVIKKVPKVKYIKGNLILLNIDYSNINKIKKLSNSIGFRIVSEEFLENIKFQIEIDEKNLNTLEDEIEKIFQKSILELKKENKYKVLEEKYILEN